MKNLTLRISFVLIILLLLPACEGTPVSLNSLGTISANSENASVPRVVTVTGDAEIKVIPDEVVITLGVETKDEDLNVAKSDNDEIVQQVLKLSQDLGIDANHVQTDFIDIEPVYDFMNTGNRRFEGYRVFKTIVITLDDISQFEDYLSGVLEKGVNYVHDIEFRTTDLRQHRDQARALAIQAAQEKAKALANELDQNVGEPVLIREEQSGWRSWYGYGWGRRGNMDLPQNVVVEVGSGSLDTESGIAPGQISINAKVTVSFELK